MKLFLSKPIVSVLILSAVSCGGGGSSSQASSNEDRNNAPEIGVIEDATVTPFDYAILSGSATDGDGDILSYNWEADPSNPSEVNIDNASGAVTGFFIAPDYIPGDYRFKLSVSDGKEISEKDVVITVKKFIETTAADGGLSGSVLFGSDVALSKNAETYAIGAENSNSSKGAVIAGRKNSSGIYETLTLCPSDALSGNKIGTMVAVSGDGKTILASSIACNSYFGKRLSISQDGGTLLIGTAYKNSNAGSVFTF
ncbi:MAG TPA: hypothetical protein PK624_07235 [Spirochaetota bacterium]|nr:hypothetical protein [Spirochaetota bacterium]HOR44573.1 hypothetical protein [Spirochaetota bacterium]HPK55988.1 hypothetical protein [Spirochaetota bacterium]